MPIENQPIRIHQSVGEDREVFSVVHLASPDLDLIHDLLGDAEYPDTPDGLADQARVDTILTMLESLPRGTHSQIKFCKLHIYPTEEEVEQEREPEYEYQDRELSGFEEVHEEPQERLQDSD
jgi:hypothetical protein